MPDYAYVATTALTAITLYAGHLLGDHALQKPEWAATKHQCDSEGRTACAKHVAVLTLTQMVLLAGVASMTGTAFLSTALVAGLGVNAWSHYWFDRRFTARALYRALGKEEFAASGSGLGSGAYRMDQDWHTAWLIPASLIIAAPTLAHVAVLTVVSACVMGAAIAASRLYRAPTSQPDLVTSG